MVGVSLVMARQGLKEVEREKQNREWGTVGKIKLLFS